MADKKLKILHCFRSPVGGIFRHVRDLAEAHDKAGHEVGILCDSLTGEAHEERLFEQIRPRLKLGLMRIPMRRSISPGDLVTLKRCYDQIKQWQPDIIHCHGAKGGAYGRIIGAMLRRSGRPIGRLYCPHGGSIHYDAASLSGKLYFMLERFFERMTDRLVFVSQYEMDGYRQKIGEPKCQTGLVYNGLAKAEFEPVGQTGDARDFLYIGMMRDLKGPDLFLDALADVKRDDGSPANAHFVGDGPDKDKYRDQIRQLALSEHVKIHDAMPARKAFEMARIIVVPSRAESMPYIVLEAIAAGKPIICTDVGGIREIFSEEKDQLVPPSDAAALKTAMQAMLADNSRDLQAEKRRKTLQARFSVEKMSKDALALYYQSLNREQNDGANASEALK